jgi:two-component system cell cycle response regulator
MAAKKKENLEESAKKLPRENTGTGSFGDFQNSVLTDSGFGSTDKTNIASLAELTASKVSAKIVPILQVSAGAESGRIISLAQYKSIVIGRGKQCELIVFDPTCSRQHAEVFTGADGSVFIRDLGSSNGTKVAGKKLAGTDPIKLKDGDRIQLGENTILKHSLLPEDDANLQISIYYRATRDNLTNAYNRHQFDEAFEREISYQKRSKHGLGIITFDVDHFKKINDTHGHPAGDEVLKTIGARVPLCIRTEDIFARLGGEEFAVLARSESFEGLKIVAERIREAMEKKPVVIEGKTISFTVSVGAIFTQGEGELSHTTFFQAADAALYEAKSSGRNKTIVKVFERK